MAIQDWSDNITVVDLAGDPLFTDEITGLIERLEETPTDVAINFAAVSFMNSSAVRCEEVPGPCEANVSLPGLAFA